MILCLSVLKRGGFLVSTCPDTKTLFDDLDIDLEKTIYYTGSDDDLVSLSTIIHQLFKKFISVDVFETEAFDKIIEFIEYQANNYGFEISGVQKFKKPQNIEPQIQTVYNIFVCFVYNEDNISIGLKSSFNNLVEDEYIDKNKSIVIQFRDEIDAKQFFRAVYLLTKNINNKLDGKNFTITSENTKQIQGLVLNQARALVDVMEYKMVSLSENKVFDYGTRKSFTSDEVCNLLGIDRQKLAYWRKTNRIKFKKHSDKKFTYQRSHVYDLLENMMIEDKITIKDESVAKPIPQPVKINKKLERLKQAQKDTIEQNTVDYTKQITDWVRIFTYKVAEHKYEKQKFFLNFGNVGMSSSPQVMINNDFQLVDYIKDKILTNTPQETLEYIDSIKQKGLQPRVDSSKQYYNGYKTLYLNNLREEKTR